MHLLRISYVWMALLPFLIHTSMMIIVIALMLVMNRVLRHVQMAHFTVQMWGICPLSYHRLALMMEYVVCHKLYVNVLHILNPLLFNLICVAS